MKKTTKFVLVAMLLAIALVCSVIFAACGGDVEAESVSLNKSSTSLLVGATEKLTATVLPEDATDKTVTWSSSNPAVATVADDGTVTAVAEGNAIITATTVNGKTANCVVDVSVSPEEAAKKAAQQIINLYTIQNTLVDADFELIKTLSGLNVEWVSSNEDAISIEDNATLNNYVARVHRALDVQTCTLTLRDKATGASKEFRFTVAAFNAQTFADAFTWRYSNSIVSKTVDLPQTWDIRGEQATITWDGLATNNYARIVDDQLVVTNPPLAENALTTTLTANFSYNGTTAKKVITIIIQQETDHQQDVYNYYGTANNIAGYRGHVISGWVVGIGTKWTDQYGQATYYVMDDDGCSAYYLYQAKVDEEMAEQITIGSHITATGGMSSTYNGLWENAGKGDFTAILDKDITPKTAEEVEQMVYALDMDLLVSPDAHNDGTLRWHTGSFASVTDWTVDSVSTLDSTSKYSGTFVTLKKGDATVNIAISNYMEGFYTAANGKTAAWDETVTAIYNKGQTLQKGDVVSVKGIVSYYGGNFQILPRTANDITVKDGAADTSDVAKATTVRNALKAVAESIPAVVPGSMDISFVTMDGGTVKYEVMGVSNTTSVQNDKLSIQTDTQGETVIIKVTYTLGGYTTYSFHKFDAQTMDAQGKVEYVLNNINVPTETITKAQTITLPTETVFEGVTISWSIKEGQTGKTWATLTGNELAITLPMEAGNVVIVASVTIDGTTDSKEFTINVAAAPQIEVDFSAKPLSEGEHILALYQSTLGKWLFGTTTIDGNYLAMTDDPDQAETYTVAKVAGSDTLFTIKAGSKFVEKNEEKDSYLSFVDNPTEGKGWEWDSTNKAIIWKGTSKNYFLGNYNDFTTLCTSDTSYITKEGNNIAAFGEMVLYKNGDFKGGEIQALAAPAEGTYKLGLFQGNASVNKWLYATGAATTDEKGPFGATTEDPEQAGDFVLTKSGNGYTIKVGEKFLVLNSEHKYTLADEQGETVWMWNSEYQVFTFAIGESVYYLGTYSTFTTLSASTIDRLSGDGNFAAHFGRIAPIHHNFKYEHVANTWTHKKSCTDEGCTFEEVTEDCTPKNNVCEFCEETYTQQQVVEKLFDLTESASLRGTYELTGVVTKIVNAYDSSFGNVTFNLTVLGHELQAYRAKGTEAANVKVGDTVTLQGKLKLHVSDSSSKTYEFDSGAIITARTPGEGGDVGGGDEEPDTKTYGIEAIEQAQTGDMYLGLYFNGKWYFATGANSGNYMAITTDSKLAGKFTVTGDATNGYIIKFGDQFLEVVKSDNYRNAKVVDAQTEGQVWKWNADLGTFTMMVDSDECYLGTYIGKQGTYYESLSASKMSQKSDTSVIAVFGQIVEVEQGGGGDVDPEPTPDETNYGTEEEPISVTEALAIANEQCPAKDNFSKQRVFVTGIVVTQPDYSGDYIKQFTLRDINDPNKTIIVYSMNKLSGEDDPDQNDIIVLSGFLKNQYGTTLEFATNGDEFVKLLSTTRGQSTITLGDHGESTVVGIPEVAQNNGSEITLNITANTGFKIVSVKLNGELLDAQADGSYKFTLHGNATVVVETADENEVVPVLATTIKFGSSGDMKEGATTELVEFEKDGFNVKSQKTNSSSANRFSDANEYRIYKNSELTVSSEKAFVKLVFVVTEKSYATVLETSINNAKLSNVTVKVEGLYVTVTFDEPVTTFGAITLANQVRVSSLEIWTLPEA